VFRRRSLPLAALLLALAAAPASAIVGGTAVPITSAPWTVFLDTSDPNYACSGSILNATHVLTAAHCVFPEGGGTQRPASAFTVLAGFSNFTTWDPTKPAPAGTQVVKVSAVRVHPDFVARPLTDDAAVLTVASPLTLTGRNVKAITLVPSFDRVAAGLAASASGYGKQNPSGVPDGKLYATTLTTISDDACRSQLAPNESAAVLCAASPSSSVCNGDSGGALTIAAPASVEVGIADFAAAGCPVTQPQGFVDVSAPEVRAFIDGAAAIPIAPRISAEAQMSWVLPPVVGSPLACTPGTWSGSPSISYTFEVDRSPPVVLQAGPSASYSPKPADLGQSIVCLISATNAGGTSWTRTGTTPPIVNDSVPPRAHIDSVRCRHRKCRLRFDALDSNSRGPISASVTATYKARCRGRHTCTRHRALTVRTLTTTTYEASRSRLPRTRVELLLRVTDAAGNRARTLRKHVRVR
jgi:hypothetical protein